MQLVLLYSFLLPSNGFLPRYFVELFGIDGSFFRGVYTFLIIITVIVWLSDINFFRKTRRVFQDKKVWWLPVLFALYVMSVFLSNDSNIALREMEQHTALLLVPVLIISEKRVLQINSELVFKSYRIGVIIGQFLMLAWAFTKASTFGLHEFMYDNITPFNHTSYVAMASTLSLILAYREFHEKRYSKWTIFETIVNLGFIFLFNSKSGIIVLLLLLVLIFLRRLSSSWSMTRKLIAFAISMVLLGGGIVGLSKFNKRFEYALRSVTFKTVDYQKAQGSSEIRRAIWSLTPEIVEENLLFGVGAGDIEKKREEVFSEFGFKHAIDRKLNSHNQFIEIFVTLGFIGLTLLLLTFVAVWLKIWNNYYSRIIVLLFFVNFLFESMLERQSGILMFTCFYGMLFILTKSNNLKEIKG